MDYAPGRMRHTTLQPEQGMTFRSRALHLRIVLVGFGAINRRVADLLAANGLPVRVAAVGLRQARQIPSLPAVRVLTRPDDIEAVGADLVIEAAGRDAVLPWGEAALQHAGAFVVSSSSAFVDDAVLDRLRQTADAHGSQLVISPGAVAGTEALAAAARIGLDRLVHTIIKPPAGWRGTAAEGLVNLDRLLQPAVFFSGSARQAAALFPANANVTVVTAMSGGRGLDATEVELVADPAIAANRHVVHGSGAFGSLSVEIENRPLADNPRSSELAALALVRLVEGAVSGIRI